MTSYSYSFSCTLHGHYSAGKLVFPNHTAAMSPKYTVASWRDIQGIEPNEQTVITRSQERFKHVQASVRKIKNASHKRLIVFAFILYCLSLCCSSGTKRNRSTKTAHFTTHCKALKERDILRTKHIRSLRPSAASGLTKSVWLVWNDLFKESGQARLRALCRPRFIWGLWAPYTTVSFQAVYKCWLTSQEWTFQTCFWIFIN